VTCTVSPLRILFNSLPLPSDPSLPSRGVGGVRHSFQFATSKASATDCAVSWNILSWLPQRLPQQTALSLGTFFLGCHKGFLNRLRCLLEHSSLASAMASICSTKPLISSVLGSKHITWCPSIAFATRITTRGLEN
jgi:hypothetical protein